MRPLVFRFAVLGGSLALCLPSWGQDAASPSEAPPTPQGREIEEIIVTAERREQSVQDVSQSLSVFSPGALESGNLQDAYDLQLKVPGFVATGGLPAITLRGLGQDSDVLGPGIDPGFQLHINDIYVSQLAVALLGFNDLERVEVLPGPQGTLFGRNSTGGSMNLHTKRPTLGAWEVSGDVDWGRYDNGRIGLALNLPLIDERLAARFFYRREWPSDANKLRGSNGFRQNTTNNALSGGHYFRSTLRWTPSDAITSDLILAYSIDKDDGGSPRPLEPFPAFSPGQSAVFFGGVNPAGATPNSESARTVRSNRPQTQRYETFWGQWITEIEIPSHVVKLNANYQFWDYAIDRDQDFTDLDAQRLVLLDKHKTWTGEISIVSDYAGRFNWLFGANYQDDNAPNTDVPIWNFQEKTELSQFAVFDAFAGFSPFSADAQNLCAGPCVFAPGDAREDWAILRALSDVVGKTLPYDSFAALRARTAAEWPHLGEEGIAAAEGTIDFGAGGDFEHGVRRRDRQRGREALGQAADAGVDGLAVVAQHLVADLVGDAADPALALQALVHRAARRVALRLLHQAFGLIVRIVVARCCSLRPTNCLSRFTSSGAQSRCVSGPP